MIFIIFFKSAVIFIEGKVNMQPSNLKQRNSKMVQSQLLDNNLEPSPKIHRANLICRILNAYSLTRLEHAFMKIGVAAKNSGQKYRKMGLAINSVFRKFQYEEKFNAFYLIKRVSITAGEKDIKETRKVLKSMQKSAANILNIILKSKRKNLLKFSIQKIRQYAIQSHYEHRNNQRRAIRTIQAILLKDKRFAFNRLKISRINLERKQKLKFITQILRNKYRENLQWSLWKLSCHNLNQKREEVQEDIKNFQQKIASHKDPEVEALREKKNKLQEHLDKIKKDRETMEEEYQNQFNEIESQKAELTKKIKDLQESNQELQDKIKKTEQQINSPYTIDEIYQTLYHNFLLFLQENKEEIYNKQKVLESLTSPLIPVDIPINSIKEENQVMQELLNEYIVMYGPKKLEDPIQMPYEYLIKQNHEMYKMLVTLLPQLDREREDLKALKDSVFKLNAKVTSLWGQ